MARSRAVKFICSGRNQSSGAVGQFGCTLSQSAGRNSQPDQVENQLTGVRGHFGFATGLKVAVLMLAGAAFGQSSMNNVPYRPQPRVLIPTVEPSQTIVSNGSVIANPNRNLRYCDFYLAAVDQTGSLTNPVLFEFSSVTTNQQSAAVVFYQRSGSDYPASLLRRVGSTITVTNYISTVTNQTVGIFTNWNSVVSATNKPPWVFFNSEYYYASSAAEMIVTAQNQNVVAHLYAPIYTNGTLGISFWYGASAPGGPTYLNVGTYYDWVVINETFVYGSSGVVAPEKTNYWYVSAFTNITQEIVSANILSVQAASSNEASAIEVYPVRQGQKWMKQTNPDIKWMCLISNGLNWYSTPNGDPIWFNCSVDWVDKIPTEGIRE